MESAYTIYKDLNEVKIMGLLRMGPPSDLIVKLAQEYGIDGFVETGTYYGGTAIWASQQFSQVFTIERSELIYAQTSKKLKTINNISLILGDSAIELKTLLPKLSKKCIFWLDAHWSGGDTYGETNQCPLIEEIKIINEYQMESFIFIDDARLFLSPPQPPHQMDDWPHVTEIIHLLNAYNQSRYIVIIEDVIIVPKITLYD